MSEIQVTAPDGTPGTIPDDQLDNAKAAGYTTAEVLPEVQDQIKADDIGPDGTYNVVAPDGVHGTVPPTALPQALQAGYQLKSEYAKKQDFESRVKYYQNELKNGPTGGETETALRGYGDEFLGEKANQLEEWIAQSKEQRQNPEIALENQAYEEAIKRTNEEQDIAHGAGRLAGFAGEAYLGAKIAGAGTKPISSAITNALGISSPILQTATKLATEGVLFNTPNAAVDLIEAEPAKAAEDLAIGGIGNVAMHGLFSLGGKAVEALKPATPTVQDTLQQAAEQRRVAINTIAKELGVSPAGVDKAAEVIPKLIDQKIITKEDTLQDAIKKIQNLDESGPEIGKVIKRLDQETGGTKTIIAETMGKAHQEITDLIGQEVADRKLAQEALGPAEERVQNAIANHALAQEKFANVPVKIIGGYASQGFEDAFNEIKKHATEMDAAVANYNQIAETLSHKLSVSSKQALKALTPFLDEINATANKGTFERTQFLKKWVGEQTNFSKDNGFINDLRIRAYGIVRRNIMVAEDTAAKRLGDAAIVSELEKNRAYYAWNKILGAYVDKTANKEVMHSTLESLSTIHAGRHGIAGVIGHALLGGYGAIAGVGVSVGLNVLKKLSKANKLPEAIGAYEDAVQLVSKAGAKQNSKISQGVKDVLSSNAAQKAIPIGKAAFTQALARWVPDATGRSHAQQLDVLRKTVTAANTNPAAFANHLSEITGPLRDEGLHKVADAYTDHQIRLMKVLQAILPKDPKMATAHPFSANVEISEIAPETKTKLNRALTVASDPDVLLEMIKNNTITPLDVAIAAAVNPATLQKMRDEFINEALKSKPNMSCQKSLSMGIFMGTNLDQSTEQLPVLQSVYIPLAPVGTSGKPGSKGSGHMSAKSQDNLDDSALTVSQKAQNI